jgi:Leucine-rich repeat (LRR) protein
LTKLEVLSAAANLLSADIPAGISELKELRELNLEFNELSGSIRSELGLLDKLEYLKLGVNLFSREIPTELGLLVNLRSFSCECIAHYLEVFQPKSASSFASKPWNFNQTS